MKFSTKEDIAAPLDEAFKLFSDFDQFERSALRRGAQVKRTDNLKKNDVGMAWETVFKLRGKDRNINGEIVDYSEPEKYYCLEIHSEDVIAHATLELIALSKTRTRASLGIELSSQSLAGRLVLQTIRLGKSHLDKRFKKKAADFVHNIEREYKSGKKA